MFYIKNRNKVPVKCYLFYNFRIFITYFLGNNSRRGGIDVIVNEIVLKERNITV